MRPPCQFITVSLTAFLAAGCAGFSPLTVPPAVSTPTTSPGVPPTQPATEPAQPSPLPLPTEARVIVSIVAPPPATIILVTDEANLVPPTGATQPTGTPIPPTGSGPGGASGIEGQTTIGPTCPVERVGDPCPPKAFQALIQVIDPVGQIIAQTRSNDQWYFRVIVPPGMYLVRGSALQLSAFPHPVEMTVSVAPGRLTCIVLQFDSGIR